MSLLERMNMKRKVSMRVLEKCKLLSKSETVQCMMIGVWVGRGGPETGLDNARLYDGDNTQHLEAGY